MHPKSVVSQEKGHSLLALAPSVGLHAVRVITLADQAGADGLFYLAQGQRRAEQLVQAVRGLAPDLRVFHLPPWDCLPYDSASPSHHVMGQRMSVLRQMALSKSGRRVLITSPAAIVQRVPPQNVWAGATMTLKVGDRFSQEELELFLHRTGHVIDDRVDEPGEAALHGQVVDIFPAGSTQPFRIEHDGRTIRAIRRYDPVSQRTEEEVDGIVLEPASEVVQAETGNDASLPERYSGMEHRLPDYYGRLETIFDYWPAAAIVQEDRAEERRQDVMEQIADAFESRTSLSIGTDHAVKPERLFIPDDEWQELFRKRQVTVIHKATEDDRSEVPFFAGARNPMEALSGFLRAQIESKRKIVLVASTERDLNRLGRRVRSFQAQPAAVARWSEIISGPPQGWFAIKADIQNGFVDPASHIAVVTAHDVFGSRASGNGASATPASVPLMDMNFRIGDIVVHTEHGLGRMEGLETVSLEGEQSEDAVRLAYADNAILAVPAAEMDRIWRYGAASDAVRLDKLGADTWAARRRKIEEDLQDTARQMTDLVAERKAAVCDPVIPHTRAYERFVARFAFSETPDQSRAIEEVLRDLASGHPMDRLVCGDVGFGKTEVALRAAVAVALAGRQVAIVAPTTVLARQHLRTFERRFAGLGIEIAHLSRLVAPAQARSVRKGLADGSIRIVVGTHALAGKGVKFHDLGLVVIDEEQRFGLNHKAKLRDLAKGGHVLTLTATPIPRTLQASLVGLQDISIIATPPVRRQPIRTIVTAFDPATVREALMRERRRAGQSFVVCSRIEDIDPMRKQLQRLVPELDLIVAHGQMPPAETDEAMVRFADGEGDVLLATNIIESGLDVPRANTMLVWRADRFGLAQLHQLRGRVGRGRLRASVYLLTEPERKLPTATEKRLRTLESLDRLGAGFDISAQDLDQRGAGSLLGEKQAGHVKLIGPDLYRSMLQRALRGETFEDMWSPELNLGIAGNIPETYVADPETRINLYAQIARLDPSESVDDLHAEIEDRFGALPQPLRNLMNLTEVKQLCIRLGIARIDAGPLAIALTFRPGAAERFPIEHPAGPFEDELRWNGGRLVLARSIEEPEERLACIQALLGSLV
ncbi:transcription-repair coupling factor [Microvirga sp. TS319]|uniref:transcription-repair coupling factor n=1 Tax=Microvirga sp. TS319 TaxID=3241165 RepID=UPI00351A1D99